MPDGNVVEDAQLCGSRVRTLADAQLDLIEGRGCPPADFSRLVAKRDAALAALTDGDRWTLGVLGCTLENMSRR